MRLNARPSRYRPLITASVLTAAGVLTLSACSTSTGGPGDSEALQVVATTTQLADFTAQVGGEEIALTGLLQAGSSAHHFDPTPADLLALGSADVLVVNGAGLETFVDSAIEASGFSGDIIVAADGIDLEEAEIVTAEGEAEAAGDHDHATAHDHDGHDHDHGDDDHDHDHGPVNPHLWTSPTYAAQMVAEVAAGLSAADPEHASGYDERAATYIERLEVLDAWSAEQFALVPMEERVLVTGHDSLRYYLHDYGIGFAGAILPSFEDNAEPSAAQIDELVEHIRERGVRAIFVESSMNPKLAQTIAREAGVSVEDEAALYADSLGVPGSGAETYIDATIHNTQTILEAWGVDVAKPPASIATE